MLKRNIKVFLKFLCSSASSSVVDLLLFAVFCNMLREKDLGIVSYLIVATVLARIISAIYNFTINYKLVFFSQEHLGKAIFKYFVLAVIQMLSSALLLNFIYPLLGGAEVLVKMLVDITIFFISFFIQKKLIY